MRKLLKLRIKALAENLEQMSSEAFCSMLIADPKVEMTVYDLDVIASILREVLDSA